MNPSTLLRQVNLALLILIAGVSALRADITVRLSVKYILKTDGTRPEPGDIGTTAGFDAEVARGNGILAATGRGFKLQVTYEDIRPSAPAGESAGYWYDLDARGDGTRAQVESAALADETTWHWNRNAINIYVNNSEAGQCSSPGNGFTIFLGKKIVTGTVLHEVGHFFGLSHTHAGDPDCRTLPPPYPVADGDRLNSTIPDHACLGLDGISMANFGGRAFSALTVAEQARVNSSWLNVMSYHQEDQLLDEQMDYIWAFWVNRNRNYVCTGRIWYVSRFGNDEAFDGTYGGMPFATIYRAQGSVIGADDVILIQTSAAYNAPPGNIMNTPCTLRASGGPVTIVRSP